MGAKEHDRVQANQGKQGVHCELGIQEVDAFQIGGKSVKREHPKTQRRKGLAQITQHSPEDDGLGLLFLKPELFPHSSASIIQSPRKAQCAYGLCTFPGAKETRKARPLPFKRLL